MITKAQITILRTLSITFLFLLIKPRSLFELILSLFLFMGAMFLDCDILFTEAQNEEEVEE